MDAPAGAPVGVPHGALAHRRRLALTPVSAESPSAPSPAPPSGRLPDESGPRAGAPDGPSAPASTGGTRPYRRVLWSSALSVLVLALIAYFTFEPREFGQMLTQLNPWLLALALFSLVPRIFFGGWRLQYVSRGRLSLLGGLRGQLAWDFFSNVTPSAVGGGPVATVYVAQDNDITLGESTAIMLFSMLLDQFWFAVAIPLLLIAASVYEVFPASLGSVGTTAFLGLIIGMLVWVFVFGYAVLFRPDLFGRLADVIFRLKWLRRWRERVADEARALQRRARILRLQPPGFYINGFLLTVATWVARLILPVLLIWSVFPELDLVLATLRSVAMSFGTVILPTPGGAGGVEGLYALFMGPLMPKALVAPTLLLWRLLGYYLFLALGIYITTNTVHRTLRRKAEEADGEAGDGAAR